MSNILGTVIDLLIGHIARFTRIALMASAWPMQPR